jgi:hypothetical protein
MEIFYLKIQVNFEFGPGLMIFLLNLENIRYGIKILPTYEGIHGADDTS